MGVDAGQGRVGERGKRGVVEADDGNILRDAQPMLLEGADRADCHFLVGCQQRGRQAGTRLDAGAEQAAGGFGSHAGVEQQAGREQAFFRHVPDVVWAMLLMFSFGQNILTGFFALFFTTFGLLTRAFIEMIDEVTTNCVEALDATGAGFIQKVFQGIIPSSLPGITTWVLYMIETNIRSSTLIGILTATGIGYLFDLYYKRLDFASASLVVVSIVILVLVIETISNRIRKVIL